MIMSETDDSAVKQLKSLLEKWQAEHDKEGYEPLDFLSSLSCLLEEQATQFYKGDPDPFDDRHPEYIQPGCSYGKLLVALVDYEDLLDKLTTTYLRVKSQHSKPAPVAIGAARVLLAAMPGLELSFIFNANDWMIDLLVNWAKHMDEPERTYATGLLVGALERLESINIRNNTLFTTLLDRLWELLNYSKRRKSTDDDKENCRKPAAKIVSDKTVVDNTSSDSCRRPSKRIKLSSDVSTTEDNDKEYSLTKSSIAKKNSNNMDLHVTDGNENGICAVQEKQSSSRSWSKQMSLVVGYSYSLKPPLSSNICQGIILDFLKCLGEYQDLLSIFLEKKALDIIDKYLTVRTYDGLLTFKALKFLASLLCHNKVVTEFVETNGIQKLLSVHRPSMESTGVSLCLYFIGCKKSAMERVCQLHHKVLVKMVKYAIWLLECSHESGRCHAALFFSVSFSFRVILDIFDEMNGLRCLMNMISTFPPVVNFPTEEEELPDAHLDGSMQTPRTVCITLKKYFEAHLVIKATSVQRSHKTEERYLPLQSIPPYKAVECSRDQFFLYLEYLREEMASNDSWKPVIKFMALDGLTLLAKVLTIVLSISNFSGRLETIRSILDVFAVTTLSFKVKLALCGPLIPNSKSSGIRVLSYELLKQKESSLGSSSKPSQRKLSSRHPKEMQEKIWKCVKNNSGIKTLLAMLVVSDPANQADELRLLACKALVGLSKYQPVKQIISKLSFFKNGLIQTMTREPVLHDKRHLHAKLCKHIESLLEQVSGKSNFFDMDTDMLRKSCVVSKTPIRFNNKELLQLIHNHLVWSGLHNSARVLSQEATIAPLSVGSSSAFDSPLPQKHKNSTNTPTTPTSRHSAKSRAKESLPISVNRKISFTRGDHAQAETPSPSNVISPSVLMLKKSRLRKAEQGNAAINAQSQFHLSSSGYISSVRKNYFKSNNYQSSKFPATLNSIVEEHLKRQHARCRNPVITVPEFSLLRPHKCPEPRYRLQAPVNVTVRLASRQSVRPPWGGQGGASADRKLIYSRFKPSYVFRGTEDKKIPLSCAAFTYGGKQLLLGDVEGNLIAHSIRSDDDHIVQGLASSPIIGIVPGRVQDAMLMTAEGIWSTTCSLHKMDEQYEHKLTFSDVQYVEFSNVLQDKVIGSNQHKATVFDLYTGQVLNTYECKDLASNYRRNCATFSPDDNLILSDGLLWDLRQARSTPIHKFDKFDNLLSGVFHPRGLEVLIDTAIWDLRNFNLLHTIPALNECMVVFNESGTIIYAVKYESDERDDSIKRPGKMSSSSFSTMDAFNYEQIALIDVRHKICDLAVDSIDRKVAVVERIEGHGDEPWADPQTGICRLYDVGVPRGEEDEEDDKSESSDSVFSVDSSLHSDEENNDVEEIHSDDQDSVLDQDASVGTDSDGWETIEHSENSDDDYVF